VEAIFIELPAFERRRASYLDDEHFAGLQATLMANPQAGDVIPDAGGLRKVRFGDTRRGKGKRGGLRVIYFWWEPGAQFWLFAIYGKGEVADLTAAERSAVKSLLKAELRARRA
jgi:hypothetical protein